MLEFSLPKAVGSLLPLRGTGSLLTKNTTGTQDFEMNTVSKNPIFEDDEGSALDLVYDDDIRVYDTPSRRRKHHHGNSSSPNNSSLYPSSATGSTESRRIEGTSLRSDVTPTSTVLSSDTPPQVIPRPVHSQNLEPYRTQTQRTNLTLSSTASLHPQQHYQSARPTGMNVNTLNTTASSEYLLPTSIINTQSPTSTWSTQAGGNLRSDPSITIRQNMMDLSRSFTQFMDMEQRMQMQQMETFNAMLQTTMASSRRHHGANSLPPPVTITPSTFAPPPLPPSSIRRPSAESLTSNPSQPRLINPPFFESPPPSYNEACGDSNRGTNSSHSNIPNQVNRSTRSSRSSNQLSLGGSHPPSPILEEVSEINGSEESDINNE